MTVPDTHPALRSSLFTAVVNPDRIDSITRGSTAIVEVSHPTHTIGYLVASGSEISTATMSHLIRHSDGFVCVAMRGDDLDRLALPPMIDLNDPRDGHDYAVAVDAATGITTGISAHDRALTVRLLADPRTEPVNMRRPGHILPVRTSPTAELQPTSAADAAIALVSALELPPVAAFAAILGMDGEIANPCALTDLAGRNALPYLRIRLGEHIHTLGTFTTTSGVYRNYEYRSAHDGSTRIALTRVTEARTRAPEVAG